MIREKNHVLYEVVRYIRRETINLATINLTAFVDVGLK